MEDGIVYLIGGDNGPLKKSLADAEKALQASGQRSQSIIQKLADKEVQLYKSGVEARIHELEKEGEANHKLILEQIKDRKAAEAAMLKNAHQIEEQIARVRKGARDKRLAELQSQVDKEMKAEAAAAKSAAAERERIEAEANSRIAKGRATLAGGMAAVFGALSLTAGTTIKQFAEFEGVLNQMAAVSNLTAKEFEQVKAVALAMGAQTKFSAVEAAQGMAELAKAGFSANDAMKSIPGVLSLAAAAGSSVGEAARIAGGAMQAFGLEADQAGRVADVLAKAANISSVDVKDLGDSFKNVAPLARASGQSLEEVTTALAVMGDNLIKSGEAGTAMKAALTILLNPSKDAQASMAKLGLSIQDTAGKMLPLSDIVDQLRQKTAKMTEVQRASTIANIFGNDAVAGMLALMNKAAPAYDRTSKAIQNAAGAADEMAAVMNRGLGASFEQLSGSVETIAIMFGEQLAPAVKTVAEYLTGLANTMAALDPETKTIIAGLAVATAAFTGLGVAVFGAAAALPVLAVGFEALSVAGGPALWTIGAIALALGTLTVATKAQSDADRDAAIKTQQERAARRESVATALDHKRALEQLVTEHDRLADKTNRTKQENDQLHAVEKRMKEMYPHLATAIASAGTSHWGNVPAINAERDALVMLIQARIMDARIAARKAKGAYQQSITAVEDNYRSQERAPSGTPDRFGMEGIHRNNLDRKSQELVAARSRAGKAVGAADQEVADLVGMLRPVSVPVARARGAGITAPAGRHRGGGSHSKKDKGAEKAVKDAKDLREGIREAEVAHLAAVNRMQNANRRVLEEGEKMALDQMAALNAGTEEAVKHDEAVIAKSITAGVEVLSAGVDLQEQAVDRARGVLRQFAGDIAALLTDPSQERFANFFKSMIQDESKVKGLIGTLADVKTEMFTAKDGTNGLAAGLGFLAKAVDPVSLAITGLGLVFGNMAKEMQLAEANTSRYREALENIADLKTEMYGGLEGQTEREIQKLNQQEAAALKPMRDAQDGLFQKAEWTAIQAGLPAPFTQEQKDQIFANREDVRAVGEEFGLRRQQVYNRVGGEIRDRADTTDLFAAAKATTDSENAKYGNAGGKYGIGGGILAAADEKNIENLAKFVELTKELNEAGRDDYGNKIGLAAELDNQLAEARAESEKRVKDLEAERLKIQQEITDLKAEELKATQAIAGESIAVRAETETQSKMRRIEEVKSDFEKRRTDLKARESEITNEINTAETEKAKNLSRINILGQERIANLNAEIAKVVELTSATDRALALERARVSGGSSSGGGGGSSGSSKSSSGQSSAKVGEVRANLAGDGSKVAWDGRSWDIVKRHGGGPVPGYPGQEVPIIAKAGEHVVTAATVAGWAAAVRNGGRVDGGAASGGGATIIQVGGVRVDAAGGDLANPQVAARLAGQIGQHIGRQIRQRGHRRI